MVCFQLDVRDLHSHLDFALRDGTSSLVARPGVSWITVLMVLSPRANMSIIGSEFISAGLYGTENYSSFLLFFVHDCCIACPLMAPWVRDVASHILWASFRQMRWFLAFVLIK